MSEMFNLEANLNMNEHIFSIAKYAKYELFGSLRIIKH